MKSLSTFTKLLSIGTAAGVALSLCLAPARADEKQERKPNTALGKSLHIHVVGYWAPDVEAMLKAIMAEVKKASEGDVEFENFMKEMLLTNLKSMVAELGNDKLTLFTIDEESVVPYRVLSDDPNKGTMEIETSSKRNPEGAKITVSLQGDRLSLKAAGEESFMGNLMLKRIGKEEFTKRKADLEKQRAEREREGEPELENPEAKNLQELQKPEGAEKQ